MSRYLNMMVGYLDQARKLVDWIETLISSTTDPSVAEWPAPTVPTAQDARTPSVRRSLERGELGHGRHHFSEILKVSG